MGLVTLTFWPWNWYASHVKGGEPSFRIWARWAFGFSSYSLCTWRTDRQKQCLNPLSLRAPGGGIITAIDWLISTVNSDYNKWFFFYRNNLCCMKCTECIVVFIYLSAIVKYWKWNKWTVVWVGICWLWNALVETMWNQCLVQPDSDCGDSKCNTVPALSSHTKKQLWCSSFNDNARHPQVHVCRIINTVMG